MSSGQLLLLGFEALASVGSGTSLALARGDLNESVVPVDLGHGYLGITGIRVYLPLILRQHWEVGA